jgi:hypothetical protein
MCDAQHIGSIDGPEPERAYQDIPPSIRRLVWRRDDGHCRVPGCRSSRGLQIHHLVHREDGGMHDSSNLALVCSACHKSHHDGVLTISGTADGLEVQRPGEGPGRAALAHAGVDADPGIRRVAVTGACAHVGTPSVTSDPCGSAHVGGVAKLDAAILRTQAKAALTSLGWKPAVAHAAVAAAMTARGPDLSLEQLIFEALRRCPTRNA